MRNFLHFVAQRIIMDIVLYIRAAEGGDDAKLLVNDQAAIYVAYAERSGL